MSVSTEQSQGTDLGSQAPGKLPSAVPGSVWDTKKNSFQLGQLFKGMINNYQYTSEKIYFIQMSERPHAEAAIQETDLINHNNQNWLNQQQNEKLTWQKR